MLPTVEHVNIMCAHLRSAKSLLSGEHPCNFDIYQAGTSDKNCWM